jgi:hypothetical protein
MDDSKLGNSFDEAIELQSCHSDFEKRFKKPIHDTVLKCLRTADQYIYTGLEKADEAHQDAHNLLEKWEKFNLKMDHRRKLLSNVIAFYKQTEDANKRLSQLEKEIHIEEEKVRRLNEKDKKSSKRSKSNLPIEHQIIITRSKSPSRSPYSDLNSGQNRNTLYDQFNDTATSGHTTHEDMEQKNEQQDYDGKRIVKRVYEFTENVKTLKTKKVI